MKNRFGLTSTLLSFAPRTRDNQFSLYSLFAASQEGFLFLPGPGSCFTDTSKTTQATNGDLVACILDESGNVNDATQETIAHRPMLLRDENSCWFLRFDGVDDHLELPSVSLALNSGYNIAASVNTERLGSQYRILLARSTTSFGAPYLGGDLSSSYKPLFFDDEKRAISSSTKQTKYTAVWQTKSDEVTTQTRVRVDQAQTSASYADTSDASATLIGITQTGSQIAGFDLYGLVVRAGDWLEDRDLTQTEDALTARRSSTLGLFSPYQLFVNGENGFWVESSNTGVFQDVSGTTVSGEGDPIGQLRDRSGNANHLIQGTTAACPTLTSGYASFDGIDDSLSVDFGSSLQGETCVVLSTETIFYTWAETSTWSYEAEEDVYAIITLDRYFTEQERTNLTDYYA